MTQDEGTGWRPEEGERVEGKIIDLTRAWSDQGTGGWYPLVVLKKADGSIVNIHCFHHTLRTRLLDRQPKVGERLIVTFHGKRETRDGKRTVAIYSVETPDTQVDSASFWQSLGAATPAATPAQPVVDQLEIPEMDEDAPF